MSRIIKFRVWNKECQSMDEIDGCNLYLADNEIYEVYESGHNNYNPYMEKDNVTDKYELMQYSEINDKFGIEIYEGDIYKYRDRTKEVRYEDGAFWFGGTILSHVRGGEIIGDKYENPELLNN